MKGERAPINLPASVHQRLLNLARAENRPLNELLQLFTIERFLYRFSRSPHAERFVLKGAQMLRAWDAPLARPTMDIDMLGRTANSIETLLRVVRDCIETEVEPDGIIFDPASVRGEEINKDAEYEGVRVRVQGTLGKIKLNTQLDFAFGDVIIPQPIWTELPVLLDFGVPRLLGYSPESAIAEKFQAMVALDMANTRLKDFYDIYMLAQTREFDGETLAKAIAVTFKRRNTPLPIETPRALTSDFSEDVGKQASWQAFLRKGRLSADGKTLAEVVEIIKEFLLSPTTSVAQGKVFTKKWIPAKGWRAS